MSILRWTDDQLAKYKTQMRGLMGEPAAKRSKYGNVKTAVGERTFDSKAEASRYIDLMSMQRLGAISGLECQVSFELAGGVVILGKKIRSLRYVADFTYEKDGERVIEDVKGKATREYKIKRHLMKFLLGLDVHEFRK